MIDGKLSFKWHLDYARLSAAKASTSLAGVTPNSSCKVLLYGAPVTLKEVTIV